MLFLYFIIFFSLCFFLPSIRVYRSTGKNPFVFKRSDSAHDLIGFYMKLVVLSVLISTGVGSFSSFNFNEAIIFGFQEEFGVLLLAISLFWILIAQWQMADSWRIGIDEEEKTALVTKGVFGYSRNPIFLGMIVALLGVLFIHFNFLNALNFFLSFVLISIQVRLEEEYLMKMHQSNYLDYKKKTARWL